MIKYVDTLVTFLEIPDEITLAINISNCPCHCIGCHSSYLAEDIGTILDVEALSTLLAKNDGITCIAFMGGDSNPHDINWLAKVIKESKPTLKVAWYSGRENLAPEIDISNFNYIKLGPYIAKKGPLTSKTTNQVFYKVKDGFMNDITDKFWKK